LPRDGIDLIDFSIRERRGCPPGPQIVGHDRGAVRVDHAPPPAPSAVVAAYGLHTGHRLPQSLEKTSQT
jgi:hypothetical protein